MPVDREEEALANETVNDHLSRLTISYIIPKSSPFN